MSAAARTSRPPTIFLVSKPLGPPWTDGSSKLVDELLAALGTVAAPERAAYWAFGKPGYAAPRPGVAVETLADGPARNLRVSARLLRSRGARAYHFFFAPHRSAVAVARGLCGLAGVVPLQTICSQPRSFARAQELCFGKRVVVLSEWTREQLVAAGVDARRLVVVPPSLRPLRRPEPDRLARIRAQLGLPRSHKVVLFPGDAEPGGGLRTLMTALPEVARHHPGAVFVIACRPKTPVAARELRNARGRVARAGLDRRVRFAGALDDFHAALALAELCVLPASTLFAKVDYPYALLEALALGVPALVSDGTPAAELVGGGAGLTLARGASRLWAGAIVELLRDDARLEHLGQQGRARVTALCDPTVVGQRYSDLHTEVLGEASG